MVCTVPLIQTTGVPRKQQSNIYRLAPLPLRQEISRSHPNPAGALYRPGRARREGSREVNGADEDTVRRNRSGRRHSFVYEESACSLLTFAV